MRDGKWGWVLFLHKESEDEELEKERWSLIGLQASEKCWCEWDFAAAKRDEGRDVRQPFLAMDKEFITGLGVEYIDGYGEREVEIGRRQEDLEKKIREYG